ncbi:histone-like transcription factor and archaeal histone [Phlyctema vagabunda]|uniref:Histone-like transcription factor and archaeal histone n=1 Tax=Phlyctema vagabunda TaxID=108571 RepID=A0ABR4P7T5_9HELO
MEGYSYAPQSPDFSSFDVSSTKQSHPQLHYQNPVLQQHQHQQHLTPQSQFSSYAPRSPDLASFANAPQPYQPQAPSPYHNTYENQLGTNELSDYGGSYMPAIPALPPNHSFNNPPPATQYLSEQTPIKAEGNAYVEQDYIPTPNMASRTPRGRPAKAGGAQSSSSANPSSFEPPTDRKNPNPDNIEIKTKFPVARIKRIMQADEEVGKVAQVTPVAVNKALELFMIQLVTGAATIARDKGGKRVTAQHLKQVVESDPQFDFLQEIVGKVGDGQEGAGGETKKRKENSDSEEEVKPKKGRGRKKKTSADD